MPILNHTHTYCKYKKKKTTMGEIVQMYRCYDPRCTYRIDKDFIIGKYSKCACGKEFILNSDNIRRAIPKCLDCSDTKEARQYKAVRQLTESLFPAKEDASENLPENLAFLEMLKAEPLPTEPEEVFEPDEFL